MFTKQKLIIKIACILFIVMTYIVIYRLNGFFLYVTFSFFGFYLLINILVYLTIRKLKWMKDILNAFDGLLVFSAVAIFIILISIAMDGGEAGFVVIFYPILGGFFFLGVLGLFFTNSKGRKGD